MSLWLSLKNKEGKKNLWSIGIPWPLAYPLLGITLTVLIVNMMNQPQVFMIASLIIVMVGLIFVVAAKVSLFCKGIWVSWRAGRMKPIYQKLYFCGYIFLVSGSLFAIMSAKIVSNMPG